MDIDRIRYFLAFADTGSLVKASEILHISQPALSKALKVLESEVGMKLIEAQGRGLRLTELGVRFLTDVRPLVTEWQNFPLRFHEYKNQTVIKIASFEVFTTYFLGHLMKYHEFESLEVHELGPGRMEEAVANGRVDLAITYAPVPMAGVDFLEITKIRMGIFGLKQFKSSKFAELPFVTPLNPVEGTPSKIMGLDGWPDQRFERKIKYRVTMMESALELCCAGVAVGYFPDFIIQLHNQRVVLEHQLEQFRNPLPVKYCQQSVFLVKRQGSPESIWLRQIAKSLRSLK